MRLEVGGPVVGLLPMFGYDQGTVRLEPGDVFVSFTDGISEAMNVAEEQWGEQGLIECVRGADGLNAAALIQRMMDAADRFAAGATQHDDMTIIVARIV